MAAGPMNSGFRPNWARGVAQTTVDAAGELVILTPSAPGSDVGTLIRGAGVADDVRFDRFR